GPVVRCQRGFDVGEEPAGRRVDGAGRRRALGRGAGVGVDGVEDAVEAFRPLRAVGGVQRVAGLRDRGGRLQHFVARRFHRCTHGCVVIGCHRLSALATASARFFRCGSPACALLVQRAPTCAARRDRDAARSSPGQREE
ncbi:unnamed protein product, partial [Pelagomonas calceolata]